MPKRLTEYADCAGCASKLDASLLAQLTSDLPLQDDPRVLVDFRTADDAGVYRWAGGPALVQTVDFFTPIVDDPYDFGQIAAANAMSDVYAMGGQPRTALAITALPKAGPSADVIREVFRGGADSSEGGWRCATGRPHGDRSRNQVRLLHHGRDRS
jgi:selenide,water dikinase